MSLYDQHLHSWNSFDCKTIPADNVARAIEVGLAGLSFTEHFDTHPSEWDQCVYDDAKIENEISDLRSSFGDRIYIGKGIEVCYQPQQMEFILDFLARHRFDVVILSVHWAFDKPVHVAEQFAGMTVEEYLANYMRAVREATAAVVKLKHSGRQPFHVLGHMDFARRYAARMFGYDGPVSRMNIVDEILTNCLEAGLVPEINTSTLRNGLCSAMPGPEIVQRYAALGGKAMSLGSDAHTAKCVGADFDKAVTMLRDAGIKRHAVFREGNVQHEPIGRSSS